MYIHNFPCEQSRLRRYCADAQDRLSLGWSPKHLIPNSMHEAANSHTFLRGCARSSGLTVSQCNTYMHQNLMRWRFFSGCFAYDVDSFFTADELLYVALEDFGVTVAPGQTALMFKVRACNDARLLLMQEQTNVLTNLYEIAIGKRIE